MNTDTLIIIPARIASTRLLNKMLADICGKPLIVHTLMSILSAGYSDVLVACDGHEIADVVEKAGGHAVLTDPLLQSGTDRVYAAYSSYDKDHKYKFVINVQGDMPFVSANFIKETYNIIHKTDYDMATVCTPIRDKTYLLSNIVKPVIAFDSKKCSINANDEGRFDITGQALYFSRSPIPFGGPYCHHVGIYGFSVEALERFVSLPQSNLEKTEKLEQVRALENGMTIGIKILNKSSPISVDTQDDLNKAREFGATLCV